MIGYLLRLQARRFARAARHAGLPAPLAAALLVLAAGLTCAMLRARLGTWTPAAVCAAALSAVGYLVHPARAPWRETTLGASTAQRWRWSEFGVVLVLATAALLYLRAPVYSLALLPAGALLAWRPRLVVAFGGGGAGVAVRRYAPFGKTPYAFVAGLRRTWWGYVLLGFVLAQAVLVGNARLAVAVVLAWAVAPVGYHGEVEPEPLLRMDVRPAGTFLWAKCTTALRQWGLWCLPASAIVAASFPAYGAWLLGALAFGALALVASVGAAYRVYPARPGVLDGLTFAAALAIAPALPLYAWWSLRGARGQLARYLP